MIGTPSVRAGALHPAIVRRHVKRRTPQLLSCYERVLPAKPELRGTVESLFHVAADGTVDHAVAKGVDDAVARCVGETIKLIELPRSGDTGGANIILSFTFHPTGT